MDVLELLWVAIPALTSLLYALLLYNLSRTEQYVEPAERWRAAFILTATLWSLCSMLLHAAYRAISPTLIARLWAVANFALPLTVHGFVTHFLARRRLQRITTIGVLLYIPIAALILAGQVVQEAVVSGGQFQFSMGPALPLVALYWIYYMYSAAFLILQERLRTTSPEFRQRLDYLLVVVGLIIGGNTLNLTPLRSYPLDILLAAVAALLLRLSVSHNHLLSVRVAFRRVVGFILLALLYIVVVAGGLYLLATLGTWALVLSVVVMAVVSGLLLLSYEPVRRRVERATTRWFGLEYDIGPLLLRLSRVSTRLRPPRELAGIILRDIRETLGLESASLFLRDEARGEYCLVAAEGLEVKDRRICFQIDSPLIAILQQRSQALTLGMLAELPEASGLWIEEWENLHMVGAEVLVPIILEEELIGFFTFGSRREMAYARRELQETFPLLAGHIATALDNSRLYAQVQAKAEELVRAYAELQEVDRIKTEIIQNVSHELRTPLTLIMGYAELLKDGTLAEEDQVKEAGRIILEHADHLRRLVEQLLAFQKVERSDFSLYTFDLRAWLEDVIKSWRPTLAKVGMQLVTDIAPNVDGVVGNESYLRQVIDNLLDNARKFSPDGGKITLRAWRDKNLVYVSVSDEGIGCPPDKLPYLFDRFYQVDGSPTRKFGGMGIGLALCKEIVERHGGSIWAESEGPGRGLTVTFTLPAAETAAVSTAARTGDTNAARS